MVDNLNVSRRFLLLPGNEQNTITTAPQKARSVVVSVFPCLYTETKFEKRSSLVEKMISSCLLRERKGLLFPNVGNEARTSVQCNRIHNCKNAELMVKGNRTHNRKNANVVTKEIECTMAYLLSLKSTQSISPLQKRQCEG